MRPGIELRSDYDAALLVCIVLELVAAAIVDAVEDLGLAYPKVDAAKRKELAGVRAALSRAR